MIGTNVTIRFTKQGHPHGGNPWEHDYLNGRISREEYLLRAAYPWFKPFDVSCQVLTRGVGYVDIMAVNGIRLSNVDGPTVPWSHYRLNDNGHVTYWWRNVVHEWSSNVPTWSFDAREAVLPIILQLLLANRFDGDSVFGRIPRDMTRFIAKIVFGTRKNPVWFIGMRNNNK